MLKRIQFGAVICVSLLLLIGCGRKNESGDPKTATQTSEGLIAQQSPDEFLYVSDFKGRAALYSFNFKSMKSDSIWFDKKETVVDYSHNSANTTGYFVTVSDYGKLGVFPYVKNVKLYLIDLKTHSVTPTKNFGNGLQVSAFWQDDRSVRLVINIIDETTAAYVEQKNILVSAAGKILVEDKKKYDMTKDGYPQLPEMQINFTSTDRKHRIITYDNNEIAIALGQPKPVTIFSPSTFKARQVEWTADGKFVVVTVCNVLPDNETLYDKNPKTSSLKIVNLPDGKTIYTDSGSGYHNFEIFGDYLIFDTGFAQSSTIRIYKFSEGKVVGKIIKSGGAGIKSIPQIPDYDA